MTKQERIFDAIGAADETLLAWTERTAARYTRHWAAWGTAAMAACLALVLLLWGARLKSPVTEQNPPAEPPDAPAVEPDASGAGANAWEEGPRVHLLSFQAPPEEQAQFYLYIDEGVYDTCWQDGVYVIRPKNYPENLPACVMEVSHIDAPPEQAAETVRAGLESRYASVTESGEAGFAWKNPDNTLHYFSASDGLAWDNAQRETFLVDDGQGGVFVVSYEYFMEAAEGHGTLFAGMAATFRVIPAGHAQAWVTDLDNTVEKLAEGVFSGEVEEALLLPNAEVYEYEADTAVDVVIRRMDKAVNSETSPTAAIVTIPYTLSLEEPGGTLEMKLVYEEGSWLAWRIEVEP